MRAISVVCLLLRLLSVLSVAITCLILCYYCGLLSLHPQQPPRTQSPPTTDPWGDQLVRETASERLVATLASLPDNVRTRIIQNQVSHTPNNLSRDEERGQHGTAGGNGVREDISNEVHHSTLAQSTPPSPPMQSSSLLQSFPISQEFHWPQPRAVHSIHQLLHEQWLSELKEYLSAMTSREVTVLTSNHAYTEVLLNWLIVAVARASLDLSQVLVLSMDQSLYSLLRKKGLNCVLVKPSSLLTSNVMREGGFPAVMMTRLSIIRLLNHWGYDVINYDTDAVLLRDPSSLLHQVHSKDHIIGTFGRFPTDLTKRWGITLCTAWLVVRSSPATEDFWEAMSRVALSSYSDQGKMNYGLQAMSVEWSLPSYNLASITESVEGVGSSGLRVSLLPYSVACRGGSCTHTSLRPGLYIWHKGGARVGEKKREGIEEGRVWFLHSDWMNSCDVEQGKDWLKCIATDHEMFTSK